MKLLALCAPVLVLVACASSTEPSPMPATDGSALADATDAADAPSNTDAPDAADAADGADANDARDAADASCALHKVYSSKNAACNACAGARCCGVLNGCFDDPRCDDEYVNCILACALLPDDAGAAADATGACLDDCAVKHPEGKHAYDVAIACVDGACSAECR